MTTLTMTEKPDTASYSSLNLCDRARRLGLFGVLAHWSTLEQEPWLPGVIEYEERERSKRSLERRLRDAKLGLFKPLADFDWSWPREIDRSLISELSELHFIGDVANVIIVGESGVGKTMLAKNLAYQAVLQGHSALFISASELLNDLAAQESSSALTRRLRHYCLPELLAIDELGYLATSSEHADLLFEVVTRRYQHKPIIITSNKSFTDWGGVFPNASCVVALVDRLVHKAEVLKIDAESYRLKEANERAEGRKKKNSPRSTKGKIQS